MSHVAQLRVAVHKILQPKPAAVARGQTHRGQPRPLLALNRVPIVEERGAEAAEQEARDGPVGFEEAAGR